MPTAFVLSGGGSRGDFQLGAITALYERGIHPDIICSTSVGSINALMLAQGQEGFEELRKLWLGLRRNDHMWNFEDWWAEIHPELRKLIVGAINNEQQPPSSEPWSIFSSMFFGATIGTIAFGPAGLLAGALTATSVSGLFHQVTADAIKDAFRIIGTRSRALLNIEPIRGLFEERVIPARLQQWIQQGGKLRLATVGLNSGELAYVTERGELINRSGTRLAEGIPIVDGVLASASIGAVFPPVSFAGDHWIDGGHREGVPLKVAIELNADPIYVICAGPVDAQSAVNRTMDFEDGSPPPNFADARIPAIAARAMLDIHLDEINAGDIFPYLEEPPPAPGPIQLPRPRGGVLLPPRPRRPRIILIAPKYPTHDITTIDPELIRVNVDYGYRVALDALDGVNDDLKISSDYIALAGGKMARSRQRTFHSVALPLHARFDQWRVQFADASQLRSQENRSNAAPRVEEPFAFGSNLTPGDRLMPGQSIASPDKRFRLIYQWDGNLVLLDHGSQPEQATWSANTSGASPGWVVMQRDGNLVMYDPNMSATPISGTQGNEDANLQLQNDGRVVIYHGNSEIWARGTSVVAARSFIIRNRSPINIDITIYKVDDHLQWITLPDGNFSVTPGSDRSWVFPQDVGQAKLIINGRHNSVVIPGQIVTHEIDDRIEIFNATQRDLQFRLFNANDIARAITLPGGDIQVPSRSSAFYTVPPDIERVAVVVSGREIIIAQRGARIVNRFDPHIYVRNDWNRQVSVKFYKPDDTLRVFTLPNGNRNLAAGATLEFEIPGDVFYVQIWVNNTPAVAAAEPADTIIVMAGPQFRRDPLP